METLSFYFLIMLTITFANAQVTITNCTELQMMQTGNSSSPVKYTLANDIDCSTIVNFIPIGNSSNPFYGEIDGQGYSIYNLKINTYGNAGLIGYSGNSNISNIVLSNSSITSNSSSGGLIGYANSATTKITNCSIQNCSISSSSSSFSFSYSGGLIGYANSAATTTITNCSIQNCPISSSSSFSSNSGGLIEHFRTEQFVIVVVAFGKELTFPINPPVEEEEEE